MNEIIVIDELDLGINVVFTPLHEWLQITSFSLDINTQSIQGVARRVIKSPTGVVLQILSEKSFKRINDQNVVTTETDLFNAIDPVLVEYLNNPALIGI